MQTANTQYAHPEFEELMKVPDNQICFDCGKSQSSWASVNNSIFLCFDCAGIHRSLGVTLSYIRSTTLDSWNDNQINFMKAGGNKRLKELLKVFEVNKDNIKVETLYASKLLNYHRASIKADVVKNTSQPIPPSIEEALIPFEVKVETSTNKGISSVSSDFDSSNYNSEPVKSTSYFGSLTSMVSSAYEKGKEFATNVQTSVQEKGLKNTLITGGEKAMEIGKDIGTKAYTKGSEIAVRIFLIYLISIKLQKRVLKL
jgi:ADP-ribosylation factor GTPase-activating protein 2/3